MVKMEKMKLHLVAPLTGGNDSLLGINIATGLTVQKWSINKATTVISESSLWNKDAIFQILRDSFCLDDKEKHAYVVAGSYYNDSEKETENTIKLMRLFKEGSIDIPCVYIYEKNERGKIEKMWSREGHSIDPNIHYHLSEDEKIELGVFLRQYTFPFSQSYIQLAIENFDQSYNNSNENLAFLSLMIAVEILFNDSASELKFRITRGMAVLLGKDKSDCRQIYVHMKKLYDKRSTLVHTGKASISLEDVIVLRNGLRLSIKKLLHLGLSKAELSSRLLEQGFGQDFEI
jgi:hypothetical protein